jgi:hypothetical protein
VYLSKDHREEIFMLHNPLLNVILTAIVTGVILGVVNYFLAKKDGEKVVSLRYIISFAVILILYSGLFIYIQYTCNHKVAVYQQKMIRMKEAQQQRIKEIETGYAKEIALLEWKNKVFTSDSEMKKSLDKATADYQLSPQEVTMWQGIAANNTIEKLIPKRNTNEVLTEYRNRLKNSLAQVKSGQTLMTSDVRILADNINTIRLIGKEYEKVLDSFRDLYTSIATNPGSEPVLPKQKKFLFFPVKTKQYNKLLNEYYEAKGNSQAMAQVAIKLKLTIEKAESEFKAINEKFEENLSFVENTSNSITFNAEKLENLIDAAISEADIIHESVQKTDNIQIKQPRKN